MNGFKNILQQVINGAESAPRGQKIKELLNFSYELDPYVRFCSFPSRKLNIKYIKKEFLWYLKGNKYDLSICDNAQMWKTLVQPDMSINSNYGQYIFGNNSFQKVAEILKEDKDSRRACFIILKDEHVYSKNPDQPCTYSIWFNIRENKLNMSVQMRSQDAIFGMGNDAPCFSFIHEMMFVKLKHHYSDLSIGSYFHFANSFHIYEKHFSMVESIIRNDENEEEVDCPKISCNNEVDFLLEHGFEYSEIIPDNFQFTKWLLNND